MRTKNSSIKNTDFDQLPDSTFVRLPTVMMLFSISAPTVWRWVKKGNIPKPVKHSPGVSGWNVGELREHLKRIRETPHESDCPLDKMKQPEAYASRIPRFDPSEHTTIAISIPDSSASDLETLIQDIEKLKPENDERRAEDIIFAVGQQVMSRYKDEVLRNLFKDRPQ